MSEDMFNNAHRDLRDIFSFKKGPKRRITAEEQTSMLRDIFVKKSPRHRFTAEEMQKLQDLRDKGRHD